MDIPEVLGCHLLKQTHPQWGSQKLFQWSVSHELTAYVSTFYLFFDFMKWPYYQMQVNKITLNHITPWNLAFWIFEVFFWILLDVNLSLNQTLLTSCSIETNLDDSVDSRNFSVSSYLPLIRKDSVTLWIVLQFVWRRYFLLHRIYLFLTGFTSFI